ncbi:hypothetical protein HMN09_00233600 [Mycena chlorophos]|uniref:Uncharacterized protein n=1 Tax=Mycena chlorophos TaxID=658473 RepID=A0A8H6WJ98_MYCCL|nr:hypothetical protein HMN09_00233600 [Mycena chlorophos]
MAKLAVAATLAAVAFPSFAAASYSWSFAKQPSQCGNVTINISGGSPPYSVLIVPYGISPLPNNIEARKIQSIENQSSSSITFKLNFPANSQLVAVVSDSTGFASGGTSVGVLVTGSSDSSCFDASSNVQPAFFYNILPTGVIAQCEQTRIWWNTSAVQGNPSFQGVIPGGDSFQIPESNFSTQTGAGYGFTWTPPLRGGTTLLLVAGDNRGLGSGGSTSYTVNSGVDNISSCLNSTSPSSTPGSPAGGSYATSTGTSGGSSPTGSTGSGGGGSNNTAAIAGGVVGGVVGLIALGLIALFFYRRGRLREKNKNTVRPDLLQDEGDEPQAPTRNELPQYYQPQPYLMAESTVGRSSIDGHTDTDGRPLSTLLSDTASRSGTPDPSSMSTGTRKTGGPMRQMRPVNIVQHTDAGPSGAAAVEQEPETVELPPAYTNIPKNEP